jgi:predicted amidohydrolase
MAQSKRASLVVFPEMSGVMAAVPDLPGVRASLLRQADLGRQRGASLWRRARARVAGSTVGFLGVDFREALARHLAEEGNALRREVERLFAGLARSYGTHIIVGAGYLPGDGTGRRSLALAFSPQGEMIGEVARVGLLPGDEELIAPGDGWTVLQTPVGRIGVLMGGDVLYPEVARLLAYRGADVLVVVAATSDPALAARIRTATLARAQENQVFVLASFLIGNDPLRGDDAQFTGRSAIMAPVEMTARHTGIMVEMGTAAAEGLIATELNFYALRELWRETELSPRRGLPLTLAGQTLASDYTLGRSVDEAWEDVEASRKQPLLLPEPTAPPAIPVAELPVVGVSETSIALPPAEPPEIAAETRDA